MTTTDSDAGGRLADLMPLADRAARRFRGAAADDARQLALIALWRVIDTRPDLRGCRLQRYASAACRHAVLKQARRDRRGGLSGPPDRRPRLVFETPDGDDGPALADLVAAPDDCGDADRWPTGTWLAVLAPLTPAQRKVVVGRVVRGRSFVAIAADTGLTAKRVAALWAAAVEVLRDSPGLAELAGGVR